MTDKDANKRVVTDPTEPVGMGTQPGDLDPEIDLDSINDHSVSTINRLNEKIEEEDNPIARMKMKEWRNDINTLLEQLMNIEKQAELMEEGLKGNNDSESARVVNVMNQQLNQHRSAIEERITTLGMLLDYAEENPEKDLLDYTQQIEEANFREAQRHGVR